MFIDARGEPRIGRIVGAVFGSILFLFVSLNLLFGSWYTIEQRQKTNQVADLMFT